MAFINKSKEQNIVYKFFKTLFSDNYFITVLSTSVVYISILLTKDLGDQWYIPLGIPTFFFVVFFIRLIVKGHSV